MGLGLAVPLTGARIGLRSGCRLSARVARLLAVALMLWSLSRASPAQDAVRSSVLAPPPAPLTYNNRAIFVLRGVVAGYPPQTRAEAARERLAGVLRSVQANSSVGARAIAQGTMIEIDGKPVFLITPEDLDALSGETMESAVERARAALTTVLQETRERRDLSRMATATVAALTATLFFLVAVWAILRATRWLARRVRAVVAAQAERVRLGELSPLQGQSVARAVGAVVVLAGWVVGLALAHLWLVFVLKQFPHTRAWGERIEGFLVDLAVMVGSGIAQAIPGLVVVVVIFVIARWLTQLVRAFLVRVERRHATLGWLDADTAAPTRRIVILVIWLFALAMAYPYLPGSGSEAFKGLSVLVGLMVSIGASGVVGQAASGMIIIYSRTLRTGEYVRIGDTEGMVTELGMFATRIRTGMGEEVVLPNAYVVGNPTRNYSRTAPGHGFVMGCTVTIGYATPWRQVHAMLLEAARRTPGVVAEPAAFVAQTALSDFYVEYRLVAYAGPETPERRILVLDHLHATVQDVFNEHGVQIMSPHYVMDPAQPQVVPKDRWYAAPAQPPTG